MSPHSMSVPVYCTTVGRVGNRYVCQGGQTKKKFLYQTNVCLPWPETLPAPLVVTVSAVVCQLSSLKMSKYLKKEIKPPPQGRGSVGDLSAVLSSA